MGQDTLNQPKEHSAYIKELMDKEAERAYYPVPTEEDKRRAQDIMDKYIDF